jgi:ATP-dependent Lon protease
MSAIANEELKNQLSDSAIPVVATRKAVIFPVPRLPIPLNINHSRTIKALRKAKKSESLIFITTYEDLESEEEDLSIEHLYSYGVIARILRIMSEDEDEGYEVIIEALHRGKLYDAQSFEDTLYVYVEKLEDDYQADLSLNAHLNVLRELAKEVIQLSPRLPNGLNDMIDQIDDVKYLVDLISLQLPIEIAEKRKLLSILNLNERIQKVNEHLEYERSMLELSGELRSAVKESIDQHQQEVFLREQMKAIQKKLGTDDEDLEQLIVKAEMPKHVEKIALKQARRIQQMSSHSSEYHVTRNYIDRILELPWNRYTEDRIDLTETQKILDQDHSGLDEVKRRIIEFLAVCQLKGDVKGPILCLFGPPGVGKTSLAQSIAKALGRSFERISLGGIRDEAEIRGHRRTYVGALPGRFIKALKTAESMNPVICLDEIDKLGQDYRGDPASALLEVLDPEQNHSFSDHYLETHVDLSQVLFITTANRVDTIPAALKDRLEIIELSSYLLDEKIKIAHQHLLPTLYTDHGLESYEINFTLEAIKMLVQEYTREAGVRNLKRNLASVLRNVAYDIVTQEVDLPLDIERARVRKALGPQKIFKEDYTHIEIGTSLGLAWTPTGGEVLTLESRSMPGKGQMLLTGQLGDVMQESAKTARSLVRAYASSHDEHVFDKEEIHIHVPSGAIPKDGPSAGVAISVALMSLALKRVMKSGFAMTGEVTLNGRVLPVGGIKEKVMAAARHTLTHIIIPWNNQGDLEKIPTHLKQELTFYPIKHIEEAFHLVLDWSLSEN